MKQSTTNFCMKIFKIVNPAHFMRPMISYLKEENKKDLIGAEIGVAGGDNSKRLLKTLSIKKLYLIEPWIEYEEDGKIKNYDKNEQKCRKLLKRWNNKIVYIKKTSREAVNDIPDDIDFIYIDGNHQYEFVKTDIELYYPKVKKGGCIGGDDFCGNFVGVVRAVLEYVDKHNVKLHSRINDWWFIKPKEK